MKRAMHRGLILFAALAIIGTSALAADPDKTLRIADGMKVGLEFTLTGPDKAVVSTNVGREPMSYVHGKGQLFPALERALVGLRAGDSKRVELLADQAYGVYDPSKKITVDRSKVPSEAKVGAMLTSKGGGPPVKIVEMNEKSVVLDMNHPLAGKNVVFDVKILSVERESEEPKK